MSTKKQKGQIPEKEFALIEKRYHNQLKRCQNERYIAVIKGWILKKAGPFLTLPVQKVIIILLFLVLAFYRVRFFCPYPIFFPEYAYHI